MTTQLSKPMPRPENRALTAPFWEAAEAPRARVSALQAVRQLDLLPSRAVPDLLLDRPRMGADLRQGPRVRVTPSCTSPRTRRSGAEAPYAYAIVQLDEGVRMPTNIVDCPLDDIRVDMPVTVRFDDVSPEWTLVKFKPSDG